MKKYIMPKTEVNIVSVCSMACVSLNNEIGDGIQLSKERDEIETPDAATIWE